MAAASVACAARAQEPAGLALDDAVRATLVSSPDVSLAEQELQAARGRLLVSRSPFDLRLTSTAAGSRTHAAGDGLEKTLSYGIGAERLLRSGVVISPEVVLARSGLSTRPGVETANAATPSVSVALPLLQDRNGGVSRAAERAASHRLESSRLSLRHTVSQSVYSVAVAYWGYLAAQRRLRVFVESEERARVTVDQTRVLVQAEERTASDLNQTLGNLASKQVAQIASEQAVVEARAALGLAIGLPGERIATLPPAVTDFPEPAAAGGPGGTEALLAGAYDRRADLGAAVQEQLAAERLRDGAQNALRPRLDLVVTSGYRGLGVGLGAGPFFTPLYRPDPQLDLEVALRFQFPFGNSRARGDLLQSGAAAAQQQIVVRDLERRIASGVWVAAGALERGAASVLAAEEAVRLSELTVQAEQRKFQLGASTLFDVIFAQDNLTSALLTEIESRRGYAVAIASARLQNGSLVAGNDLRAVDWRALLTAPW
ncbi:MAG: TolC family protein [Vicinamibacteria bacterium]